MNVYYKNGKLLIEIDKDIGNIEDVLDYIRKKEQNKNMLLDFLLKHQGELKDEDIATEEELHMQGD